MQKYQSIISGTNGSVIRNVPVTVLKEDGSLAEIFMDREGQVQAPNPLVTDSRGVFYFYAKNGRYSLRTAADGVQITDADTVLLFDPDETVIDGPIADAVRRAEDAAERAETALSDSGLQNLVQDAQDAAANAVQAVIDANQAAASIDAARIEVGEAKEAAQAAAQTASNAAIGAQAVKDSLLTYSGTLSATPAWSAVPAHEDLDLDAQTQAALNRIEKLKDDQQILKQRADKSVLSFPDYAAASAAAATLPDGQSVEIKADETRFGLSTLYEVQSGALVFSGGIRNFRRNAVGAVVLEYQDRISASPINIVEFGAKDDKEFDSTSAFLKAAAHAQTWASFGKKAFIEVPTGDWKVTSKITFPFGCSILGGGTIHAHTSQLFEWSGGVKYVSTGLKNIDVVAYVAPPNDGSGFALNFYAIRADRCIVDVNNFNVRSSDGITRSYGFDNYIKVHDLLKVTLSGLWFDCCFKANAGNVLAGQYLQNAIRVTGITTQLLVEDFLFASVYRGVYGTGSATEGVRISHGDFVAVYYGIDFPEYSKPGIWIDSVHINAVRQPIRIAGANTVDITIADVWLYRSSVFFTDTDWTAASIEGATARTNISNFNTSVSITTDTVYGIKLKDCSGVNAVGLGLSQTNKAIHHEGTNTHVNYDDVVFNGLGASGVGLTTTATDNNITLGSHKFLGSVGTKYSLGSGNTTVVIDTGRVKYRALSSSASISSAASVTFTAEDQQQLRILNFGAGTGAFTYDVNLDKANARQGDFIDIRLTYVASANPSCRILNGVGGAVLATISGNAGSSTRYFARVIYDGGNWSFADCHQSLF